VLFLELLDLDPDFLSIYVFAMLPIVEMPDLTRFVSRGVTIGATAPTRPPMIGIAVVTAAIAMMKSTIFRRVIRVLYVAL